jgi:septum formation protein
MKGFILGSQSPRRKEILGYFSIPFEQISSDFDEEAIPFEGDPAAYATKLALGKSKALQNQHPDAFILTADTVVFCNGKIYNKPKDEEEAFQFVTELQGKWHSVFTAVSLTCEGKEHHTTEESRVLFNSLTPEQIRHYHNKIHWADKAGGYAIQLGGGLIIKKIDGCYYNIMGLPINSVRFLLMKFGIELWDFVK